MQSYSLKLKVDEKRMKNPTITSVSKNAFGNLFILLVVILMVLPFFVTFNEFLTRIVESTFLFKAIEKLIVPYEVMLVRTIISFFSVQTQPGTVSVIRNGIPLNTPILSGIA